MRSELAAMIIALAVSVLACGEDRTEQRSVASGNYVESYATAFSGDVDPPNAKTTNVDRAAGTLTVTYRNDEGAEVVERWKIVSSRFD